MIVVKLKGGLGNQMFQYAFGKSLSLRSNTELILDTSQLTYAVDIPHVTSRAFELSVFGIPETIVNRRDLFGFGPSFPYQLNKLVDPFLKTLKNQRTLTDAHPTLDVRKKKDILVDGYFQKERYFLKDEALIRRAFVFKAPLDEENEGIMKEIVAHNSVSIHVRRGDYVANKVTNHYHGVCGIDYYEPSIHLIKRSFSSPRFFVFSDDVAWCRDNLSPFLPSDSLFISHNTGPDSYKDMQLMSRCKHHIIANSSFSWWGAWLNASPTKTVVAPKHWFANDSVNTEGLYPKSWLVL